MNWNQIGHRLLNSGWEFTKMPFGSSREEAEAAAWTRVELPHDWLIWQAGDLYETADAWYRRTLTLAEAASPTVLLCFDGVYMDCDVLLNGEILCTHPYGYTAFQVNLSGKIRPGENEILVHIRHRSPNTRWYSGSGIYRDVTLYLLPESYLVPDSLYTVTARHGEDWSLRAEIETVGDGEAFARLTGPDGKTAAQCRAEAAGGKVCLEMEVPGGKTWSPDHPVLYTLEYGMGEQVEKTRIGLRELQFLPESGFWINGENIKMKGVCLHHDLGALGAAFHPAAARRQLEIMKNMGVNALRTSHNPPARQMLDLCDEMGILVADEAFDMWERPKTAYDYARFFQEHEAEDVASWIRRDRNHACVVMWSIGNEIYDMFADERGTEVTRMLRDQVRSHDPSGHAAVTFGSNYMPWEGAQRCAEKVKIPGYNYAERLYDEHHAAHPDWVIYGSETSSVFSSRGIYHFPASKHILSDEDLQCSALGNSVSAYGAQDLRKMIVDDLNNPYSMGQFVWSGIDYIGEPTPYHTRSCYFGQVDTAGFPKDAFYLFKSLWNDEPMIHLGVHWDWNEGQMIDIPVMSNCRKVEVFINGRSLGLRELDPREPEKCMAMYRAPFERGTLTAVGYDEAGNRVLEDVQETPGDTAGIRMSVERGRLKTDGSDLVFVQVSAEDAEGRPVVNARDRVYIRVSGGGVLLGVDNGDSSDTDEFKGTTRRLFGGKMILILGSSGTEERAKVDAWTSGGLRTEIVIEPAAPETACEPRRFLPEIHDSKEDDLIPVRRVEIIPLDGQEMNPDRRETTYTWKVHPENAGTFAMKWQVTTVTGIPSPAAEVTVDEARKLVRVTAKGDGELMLRALYGNAADHPEQISQIEMTAQGLGRMELNPYELVIAGLHDLQAGDIGAGNEQGICFARDTGKSMVGFSHVDFGPAGSDRMTLFIFALDDKPYDLWVYDGVPGQGGRLIEKLTYQKKSIWNVYQEETWTLPERLTGQHTLCFEAEHKFHFRGFRFEKQSRAFAWQKAGSADALYGDSFRRDGDAVMEIGNNVTMVWENMDFGDRTEAELILEGQTPLENNAITVRMENEKGQSGTEVVRFAGTEREQQRFRIAVPGGNTRISFVFLPGCQFDFFRFRFA